MKPALPLMMCALALGCSKSESEPAATSSVPALPEAEVERAQEACTRYVARVCKCAEGDPSLQSECDLAKARPSALQTNLEIVSASGLNSIEVKAVQKAIRNIASACFEADNRLDPGRCPRVTSNSEAPVAE